MVVMLASRIAYLVSSLLIAIDFHGGYGTGMRSEVACLSNHDESTVVITCVPKSTITLHQVRVGYNAGNTCSTSPECPFEVLSPSNTYYKYLMNSCQNRATCTLSSNTLYTSYANSFSRCDVGGKVRNIVNVTYLCNKAILITTASPPTAATSSALPAQTTPSRSTSLRSTTRAPRLLLGTGFSLPAIPPLSTLPTAPPLPRMSRPLTGIPNQKTQSPATTMIESEGFSTAISRRANNSAVTSSRRTNSSIVTLRTATRSQIILDKTTSSLASMKVKRNRPIANMSTISPKDAFNTTDFWDDSSTKEKEIEKSSREGSTTNVVNKWILHVLIPFIAGLILVVVVLAIALGVTRRRRRRRRKRGSKLPPIPQRPHVVEGEYTSTLSTTYDTISGIFPHVHTDPPMSRSAEQDEDAYYSEPGPAPSDISSGYSSNAPQCYAITGVHSAHVNRGLDSASLNVNDQYYEAISLPDDEPMADDVYAEIRKDSAASAVQSPVLFFNDVYERTDSMTPLAATAGSEEDVEHTVFIENDLYNSWG